MVAWTLVFHLIGLVFWLGDLLIVTHVLAIHSGEPSPEARVTLGRLEMKLLKGLAHPGAALMVITGIILVTRNPEYLGEFWLRAKLLLVLTLIVLDLRVYFRTKAFQSGRVELQRGECMAWHGAIALVFFAILILVLVKPFGLRVRRGFVNSAKPGMAYLGAAGGTPMDPDKGNRDRSGQAARAQSARAQWRTQARARSAERTSASNRLVSRPTQLLTMTNVGRTPSPVSVS